MNSPPNRKRATIVGASSGIGRATALAFAKAGIDVALVGRSQDKLEAVAIAAKEVGVKAKAYSLDLAKLEEVQPKIAAIAADFGGVDILVNSAGIGYTNPLSETTLADWQQVINLNLSSVFQCILGVLPGMRDRANGLIINVASIAAQSPFPGWGAYCASKAGLVAFSKVLAAEERANGIRVANIYPGAVNTPLWDSETVRADFDRAAMLNPDIVARAILYVAQLPAEAVIEEMTVMPSAGTL
ncbi:MAG: SDR family oxidoreductase [Hydrococcus sp. C42_A2020_068]|uniref:SDR family oxidoreductase n=1 Tax=Pleurocapsa sp. PCC 7327 TaxID=118163 RepID=UPI00029FD3F5|nr:SDR family oxidoreductase [Pleurocapsa sp. PCC 7327]AFY77259.1 short-chain alcohol dehydrogenase [Pleurocapsa sp. PCC 7327]MBF2022701.1 SDR family oxidoreductase [Hydrococcus sp. C42_A2020_068]